MEGPTPVSALIHAATMVTAGVFLLIRFSILLEYCPNILKIILFLGTLTAFISASIGSFQYDVKKIIAYSTCSQLGYMVVSCGLSNYILSLYHLANHAFFKALLFLSSGLLIAMLGEQDIRKYNIIKEEHSTLFILFLIPNLSLCGFPFFSGAFSKELIIQYSKTNFLLEGNFIFFILLLCAGLTTFYSFKLLYSIFIKKPTFEVKFIFVELTLITKLKRLLT
jgi:NADH-ubiquinone oxidoreductase chain 5